MLFNLLQTTTSHTTVQHLNAAIDAWSACLKPWFHVK